MQIIIYRLDKQRGPTVQHRELYSLSCDKHKGKKYEKECINTCITETLIHSSNEYNIENQQYFNKIFQNIC